MEDIDLGRLSSEERAEHTRLGDIRTYSLREKLSAHRLTFIGTVAWLVLGSILLAAQATRLEEPRGTVLFVGALVFVLLGFVVIIGVARPYAKRAVRAQQAAYLDDIGYATRSPGTQPPYEPSS